MVDGTSKGGNRRRTPRTVPVVLPAEVCDAIKREARQQGITVNQWIRQELDRDQQQQPRAKGGR